MGVSGYREEVLRLSGWRFGAFSVMAYVYWDFMSGVGGVYIAKYKNKKVPGASNG